MGITRGATGGGSSSRRGGCGRGGMAVFGGLGGVYAGTGGKDHTASGAENQGEVVRWACEE